MKFLGVTILQGVEISIFLLISEWALQQCSATGFLLLVKKDKVRNLTVPKWVFAENITSWDRNGILHFG